jgi:NADH:ubiquinone oxidoreductase subunit H
MFWHEGMLISGFAPTGPRRRHAGLWITLLTFLSFALKTAFFILVFMWVRWTLPGSATTRSCTWGGRSCSRWRSPT